VAAVSETSRANEVKVVFKAVADIRISFFQAEATNDAR
jgi:hypothetical protein